MESKKRHQQSEDVKEDKDKDDTTTETKPN